MGTLAKLLMGASGGGVPTEPGTPYGGGFYAGKIMIGRQAYALVVAPRVRGEAHGLQWKASNSGTSGTNSRNDGWANTQAMGTTNHPAAAFCRGLNINGYDDWYLPSQDELEILYRAFKPTTNNNSTSSGANPNAIPPTGRYSSSNPSQTDVDVFKSVGGEDFYAGYYWSSTQDGAAGSRNQNFNNGLQLTGHKALTYQVRAVRRIAI